MGENVLSLYVLITRPLSERFVVLQLAEAKPEPIAAFFPIITRFEWREGRRMLVHRPMLPRYVFAATDDLERDYAGMRHARRVADVLACNGKPYALPDDAAGWVADLALNQALGVFDYTIRPKPKLSINQQVRIIAKAWTGHVGKITEMTEKTVSVHVPGRLGGKITMQRDQVEVVEDVKGKAA